MQYKTVIGTSDFIQVHHDTARVPWFEKPREEVGESSRTAEKKDPQGRQDEAVRDGSQEEGMNRFGVRMDGNEEQDVQKTSSEENNDFDIIV